MEILCLDQFSTLGGGQQCFLDLVPAFHTMGWQVRALLPGEGPFKYKLSALGCDVPTFPAGHFSNKYKPLREFPAYCVTLRQVAGALARQIQASRPGVLYVNGPRFLPAAAWAAYWQKIPLLFHAHNRVLQGSAVTASGVALAASQASVVSCCSYAAQPLARYVPAERMRIVYSGVPNLRPSKRIRSRVIQNIGVVGRVAPEKGQLEFVRAARLFRQLAPGSRFFVIGASPSVSGDPYHSSVIRESQGLPVFFESWHNDPISLMKNLDLLVVPSRSYDAAPRVILEAFSAGVPVVAFRSGGIPELIEDDTTGFLVNEHTPTALAARIAGVLRMSDREIERIITDARKAWSQRFHINRYRDDICEAVLSCAHELPVQACA